MSSDTVRTQKSVVEVVIPLKENSQRVPGKNLQKLGGQALFQRAINSSTKSHLVDKVTIFSSTSVFIDENINESNKINWIERSIELDNDSASITDVLSAFCSISASEIIVLFHATAPFISENTLNECIESVSKGEYSSAFVAQEIKKFLWFEGKPVNYDLGKSIPRTQDLSPVYEEQSGLYVFKREDFLRTQQRISSNNKMIIVDEFEGHDIDTHADFILAEAILNQIG